MHKRRAWRPYAPCPLPDRGTEVPGRIQDDSFLVRISWEGYIRDSRGRRWKLRHFRGFFRSREDQAGELACPHFSPGAAQRPFFRRESSPRHGFSPQEKQRAFPLRKTRKVFTLSFSSPAGIRRPCRQERLPMERMLLGILGAARRKSSVRPDS